MKKNNKDKSLEDSLGTNKKSLTSEKKIEQGGENVNFPQEYEERLSMDIRMKPQPLAKKKLGFKGY